MVQRANVRELTIVVQIWTNNKLSISYYHVAYKSGVLISKYKEFVPFEHSVSCATEVAQNSKLTKKKENYFYIEDFN